MTGAIPKTGWASISSPAESCRPWALSANSPICSAVEEEWRWSGSHYKRTALQWLELFDLNRAGIDPILRDVYGADATVWRRRWRMFFLATAESFGFKDGSSWGVNHYRLKPA